MLAHGPTCIVAAIFNYLYTKLVHAVNQLLCLTVVTVVELSWLNRGVFKFTHHTVIKRNYSEYFANNRWTCASVRGGQATYETNSKIGTMFDPINISS